MPPRTHLCLRPHDDLSPIQHAKTALCAALALTDISTTFMLVTLLSRGAHSDVT